MRFPSPLTLAVGVMLACLASAALVLFLALNQPSLGLDLAVPAEGEGLLIEGVDRPELADLDGARMTGIAVPGGPVEPVMAITLIEEPDKLNDAQRVMDFRQAQDRIRALLSQPQVELTVLRDGLPEETRLVEVQPNRTLGDLSAGFWAQLITGFAVALIGGWIWALNPQRASHVFLYVTGLGLQLSAFAAALYSGRELALSLQSYEVLAPMNTTGALTFGAGLTGLFLVYPRRLVPAWMAWLLLPLLLAPLAVNLVTAAVNPVYYIHLPTLIAMLGILVTLAVQWICARRDPLSRAAMKLVTVGVLLGAGGFVLTTTLPALMGIDSQLSQAFSFPLFLLVYAGVALAVRRYRFFDLERWSFQVLFYIGGAALLLLLDAFLVFSLSVDRRPALGVALLLVTLGYLPLRDRLTRLVMTGRRQELPLTSLVRAADEIALERNEARRVALWQDLLQQEFAALGVEPIPRSAHLVATIEEEGAALAVPAIPPLPAIRLRWKRRGRRLFSSVDARKAQDLVAILTQLVEARLAFEAGMNEERERIARDVHDNIGMRLTSALGQTEADHKNELIRETFTDIRRILTQGDGGAAPLGEIVADMRVELADYLDAQGMAFDWPLLEEGDERLSPGVAHALRSLLRESVHNAARHSGADRVSVQLWVGPATFRVAVSDSGAGLRGAEREAVPSLIGAGGNGLANLRRRIADVGGRVSVVSRPGQGFRIEAEMPFTAQRGGAEDYPTAGAVA